MELLEQFKSHLLSQKKQPSQVTIKNYTADIRHFISWIEKSLNITFDPRVIKKEHWIAFSVAKQKELSEKSLLRHLSSLRKFFFFLLSSGLVDRNPFDLQEFQKEPTTTDPWQVHAFKETLKKSKVSKVTIKNYGSDIQQFLHWIDENKKSEGITDAVIVSVLNPYFLEQYKTALLEGGHFSKSSIKRKISSIKKFILWQQELRGDTSPTVMGPTAEDLSKIPSIPTDTIYNSILPEKTSESSLLHEEKSPSFIDSIILGSDLRQSPRTTPSTNQRSEHQIIPEVIPAPEMNSQIIDSERSTIMETPPVRPTQIQLETKPVTPFHFLEEDFKSIYYPDNLIDGENQSNKISAKKSFFANMPPVRLVASIVALTNFLIDVALVLPLIKLLDQGEYFFWKTKGKPVFAENRLLSKVQDVRKKGTTQVLTYVSTIYSQMTEFVIRNETDLKKKVGIVFMYLAYRPAWYQRYHRYPIVHYVHFAVLLIVMSVVGQHLYGVFFPANSPAVLGAATNGPPRLLSFRGRLTDKDNNPITSPTDVRFAVYTSRVASGSALLWQEVDHVRPDNAGYISVPLGAKSTLSSGLFSENNALWLGVTIQQTDELRPRQQLATTALAANSQTLEGLSPITDPDAGTRNVVLALDSNGNVVINDTSDHTFQATGGSLILSGSVLALQTSPGSSTDVTIAPDGFGEIDIQKPIHNTSNNNNIPSATGAVEVDDNLAVLASSSGQSAFTINQNAYAPLISASSSGIARFTIENDGSIVSAGNLTLGGFVNSDLVPADDTHDLGNTISQWNNLYVRNIVLDGNQLIQPFTQDSDTISPVDPTKNFSLGLSGTNSATFTVIAGTGDIQTQGNIKFTGSSPVIEADNGNTLTLGGSTTGAVAIAPNNQEGIYVNGSGAVGIGTQTIADATALHIEKDSTNNLIYANQTGTGNMFMGSQNGTTKFVIGNNGDTRVIGAGLCVSMSTVCESETLDQGTIYAQTITPGNGDVAEKYTSAQHLEPGDVVIPANDGNNDAVVKSTALYQQAVIGVVSTNPGVVLNGNAQEDFVHPYSYPIALSGRVPVKVSIANGVVRTGDLLTSSPVPGIAMKATEAGPIIGKALEDFTSPTPGRVMAYISISWGNPKVDLADSGNINAPESLILSQNSDQNISSGDFIAKIANQIQIVATNISSNIINAKNIVTGTETVETKLISPVADIAMVHSNIIAPLSDDGNIALRFHNNSVDITNGTTATAAAVATIDNQGNATFSGRLTSDGLTINNDATISGVLHAGKILASEIEGLDSFTKGIPSIVGNISGMGEDDGNSLAATSVAIGSQFFLSNNSINVLSGDLQLQPLQEGGVSIAGGQVHIDSTGNLTVNGKAIVNDTFAARIISPLPNQDLVLKLDNGNDNEHAATFKLQNVSGNDVFSINQLGDIIASGEATISKLRFHVTKPAFALSDTEMVASGSAGVATVSASRTFVKIDNTSVTDKSLIYITPVGNIEFAPFLLQQTPHQSFTVGIDQPSIKPTTFNWLIIN